MNASIFVSDQDSTTDLPPPSTASTAASPAVGLPRPLPIVNDTGRISFGAACRIPVQK